MREPVLCYVSGDTAWFTDDLATVWGDDWNDAPYEHNAGPPYEDLVAAHLKFETDLVTPDDGVLNSSWSVQDINRRRVPWLQRSRWDDAENVQIWAGMTIGEFIDAIESTGGTIYVPRETQKTGPDGGPVPGAA